MSIRFECSQCKKQLEAENDHVGMILECPQCHCSIEVPSPALKAVDSAGAKTGMDKKNNLSRWGCGCLSVVAVIVVIGVGINSCNPKVNTSEVGAIQSVSQRNEQESMPVDINDILAAYEDNEVNADNIYKGKSISVSGYVDSVKKDLLGSLYLTLGTKKDFEIPQIQAFFKDAHNDSLARLRKGDKVTIEGQVDGLMMNVIMKKCIIK